MDIITKLYELIIKDPGIQTFNDNKELFYNYYYNVLDVYYYNPRNITIYEYLLKNNIEDESMPFLKSMIFYNYHRLEQRITQNVYIMDSKQIPPSSYKELESYYNRLKKLDFDGKMINYDTFTRDLTASMIVYLNKYFFTMEIDDIKYMLDKIQNNSFLNQIIQTEDELKMMDKNYLFQYISRFMFTKEFLNLGSLEHDLVLNSFKSGNIKNREVVKKIITSLNISQFSTVFDQGLKEFATILDIYFKDDELSKKEMFNHIYDELVKEGIFRELTDFIIYDKRATNYITEENKNTIINRAMTNYPVDMTDEEVLFFLNNNPHDIFLINLLENMNNSNWREETKNKVLEYSQANNIKAESLAYINGITNIKNLINGQKLSPIELFYSLKSLLKFALNDESLNVYLVDQVNYFGCAVQSQNAIKIRFDIIKKMCDCDDINRTPEAFKVLETIFHEARHITQYHQMHNKDMDETFYTMYKENLLENILSGYYHNNYFDVSFEKDARINGARATVLFLETFFPEMQNIIEYYQQKLESELSTKEVPKKIFELGEQVSADEALEKLISINPQIIEMNEQLLREYNRDGLKINQNNRAI